MKAKHTQSRGMSLVIPCCRDTTYLTLSAYCSPWLMAIPWPMYYLPCLVSQCEGKMLMINAHINNKKYCKKYFQHILRFRSYAQVSIFLICLAANDSLKQSEKLHQSSTSKSAKIEFFK